MLSAGPMCRVIYGCWQQKEITSFSFGSRRRNTEINPVESTYGAIILFFGVFFLAKSGCPYAQLSTETVIKNSVKRTPIT